MSDQIADKSIIAINKSDLGKESLKILDKKVLYFPFFSHPDPTVKRKSGFLTPSYGYSKRNRFYIKIPYYYAPKNNLTWDMTLTSHQNGKTGHLDQLNIRKEYDNSSLAR